MTCRTGWRDSADIQCGEAQGFGWGVRGDDRGDETSFAEGTVRYRIWGGFFFFLKQLSNNHGNLARYQAIQFPIQLSVYNNADHYNQYRPIVDGTGAIMLVHLGTVQRSEARR